MKVKSDRPGSVGMPEISGIAAAPLNITAFAGLRVIAELICQLGIREIIEDKLSVKKRARGYSDAEFVIALVLLQLCGTNALDDLDRLRGDSALLDILGLQVPASYLISGGSRCRGAGHRATQSERHVYERSSRTPQQVAFCDCLYVPYRPANHLNPRIGMAG